MTDMIEKVARAMSVALGEEPDGSNHTWDGSLILGINGPVEYKNWEGYKAAAKAAIEAMREPTDKMLKAAMAETATDLKTEWQAMVDAALGKVQ